MSSIPNEMISQSVPKYAKFKYPKKLQISRNNVDYLIFNVLRGHSKFLIKSDYKNCINQIETTITTDPKHIWFRIQFIQTKKDKKCVMFCCS